MAVLITQRALIESEISQLICDGRLFPHVAYVSRARWQQLSKPYVIESDKHFVGVCAVYYFGKWIKLGPLEILNKYHGMGFGKCLLKKIVEDNQHLHIFIGSSNPSVKHIIESLKFRALPGFLSLPKEVKLFLLRKMSNHLSASFFYEGIKKGFFLSRKDIKYYIKNP